MSHTWAHSVLDNMAKPVLLSLFPTRARIVDVACGSCGEQLAMVTESANGPWLTVWAPTTGTSPAPAPAGETLWAMATGPIPQDAPVDVRCFEHGHGTVDTGVLREKVGRYRAEGARQLVPVQVRLEGGRQCLSS